jgi:dihydrofolate synthase / folylpolyglutamate synthase
MLSSIAQLDLLAKKEYTGTKLGLGNIRTVLRELNNPHDCYPSIHVAGTNGKGSTSSFIANILAAAGYKVGLYTSPHFLDCRERIRINGKLITQQKLRQVLDAIFATNIARAGELTYFELLTAAAFKYFADEKIDLLVCEVGLGGRLDATNILNKKLISVITSIDYDHMEFLGNTLPQIAHEKAGIIKRGVPVVVNTGHAVADQVVREQCQKQHATPYFFGKEFSYKKLVMNWHDKEQVFSYYGIKQSAQKKPQSQVPMQQLSALQQQRRQRQNIWHQLHIKMLGNHQLRNASLAIAAIELITRSSSKTSRNYVVTDMALRQGLAQTFWIGRIDIRENVVLPLSTAAQNNCADINTNINDNSVNNVTGVNDLPPHMAAAPHPRPRPRTFIIDGAHNTAGAKVLRRALEHSPYHKKGITIIMSVLCDKDYRHMCQQLKHIAQKVIVFQIDSTRALDGTTLCKEWHKYLPTDKVLLAANMRSALAMLSPQDENICITGSLYGISAAIALFK